jgi:predicted RNase H-like nuclease (RuvC/YqgF family)
MKKKSLTDRIINAATINPDGVTAAQLKNAVPNTGNAVSVALWKLKKSGVLSHDPKTGVYKLTDVNKTQAPVENGIELVSVAKLEQAKAKRGRPAKKTKSNTEGALDTANKTIKHYESDLKRADERYLELSARMMNLRKDFDGLREQHEDALAIIRYLEDKMFKVIQLDARRGHA